MSMWANILNVVSQELFLYFLSLKGFISSSQNWIWKNVETRARILNEGLGQLSHDQLGYFIHIDSCCFKFDHQWIHGCWHQKPFCCCMLIQATFCDFFLVLYRDVACHSKTHSWWNSKIWLVKFHFGWLQWNCCQISLLMYWQENNVHLVNSHYSCFLL